MEENKVARKLREIIHAYRGGGLQQCINCNEIAERILQSPDLLVTLAEPRYYVDDGKPGYVVIDRETNLLLAEFVNGGARQQRAKEYCDWLNSKEPK